MTLTSRFTVLVEDDNGRYFTIMVEAKSAIDARTRVSYILEATSARIVQVSL